MRRKEGVPVGYVTASYSFWQYWPWRWQCPHAYAACVPR